jgi:hypothetical protein
MVRVPGILVLTGYFRDPPVAAAIATVAAR